MVITNTTAFTTKATATKQYRLELRDPSTGGFHPVRIERNGEIITHGGELTFFINPDSLTKNWPARTTITQTPYSHWVDSFGVGLPKWHLRGQTGWRERQHPGRLDSVGTFDGYLAYHALHDFIVEYYAENSRRTIAVAGGSDGIVQLLELRWFDLYDDDVWIIEPDGIPQKIRSASHPHIIHYEWQFTGIQDLKAKRTQVPDTLATNLNAGSDERTEALSNSLDEVTDLMEKDLIECEHSERENKGETSKATETMKKAKRVQDNESEDGKQSREIMNANTKDAETVTAKARQSGAQSGTLSVSMESALKSVEDSACFLGLASMTEDTGFISQLQTTFTDATTSLKDLVVTSAGDIAAKASIGVGVLDTFIESTGASFSKLAESGKDLLAIPLSGLSLTEMAKEAAEPAKTLGQAIRDIGNGTKDVIEGGIGAVQETVSSLRKTVSALGTTMNSLRIFSSSWRLLARLRRSMSRTLCGVQSILAFPYLFRRDLMRGMQGILDLFKLSGCATSFPNIPSLSWSPSIPLPKVIT